MERSLQYCLTWTSLFQRNVKSLIDSKLEKFKNLWEESHFYWGEIEAGTLKFDRVESEVSVLLARRHDIG